MPPSHATRSCQQLLCVWHANGVRIPRKLRGLAALVWRGLQAPAHEMCEYGLAFVSVSCV
eukprot:507168-Prymnesium_polylepis.5